MSMPTMTADRKAECIRALQIRWLPEEYVFGTGWRTSTSRHGYEVIPFVVAGGAHGGYAVRVDGQRHGSIRRPTLEEAKAEVGLMILAESEEEERRRAQG